MKTRSIFLSTAFVLSLVPGISLHATDEGIFKELDVKIARQLKEEEWHEASKAYIAAIWTDYKTACLQDRPKLEGGSIFSKLPDMRRYEGYVGRYVSSKSARVALSLEITKTVLTPFIVKLEDHEIPAVAVNRSIVFTTGDVVYSFVPKFGSKPYAQLELCIIVRLEGKYYFLYPGERPSEHNRLFKVSGP